MVCAAASAVLGTAGWAAWGQLTAQPPVLREAICVGDRTRPEYIADAARHVFLATVTERAGYLEEEPGDGGGVQLSSLRVEENLKGTLPAEVTVGQAVARAADGTLSTPEPLLQVLEPGHRYVVSLVAADSYGDGLVWGAVRADAGPRQAAGAEAVWRRAVAHPREQPPCEDTFPDPGPTP